MSETQSLPPVKPFGTVNSRRQESVTTAVAVSQTVNQAPSQDRAFVLKGGEEWAWDDLRDYVVTSIEQRFGTFPRDNAKEYGIFNSFIKRHGANSAPIARYAFEVCDGWWANATISVNRFCKASDPYFSDKIVARLTDLK